MRETFSIRFDRDVPVEMRDGMVLYADVARPAAPGRYPVLLQRSIYNKEVATGAIAYLRAVQRGYAVVMQDCRGRFASDGEFRPFHQEIDDGYDTVEWCARQPWSDGQVGMYGVSYVGATQWLAAVSVPPSLRCIIPTFTSSDYYEGWTYQGGALQWGFMCNWILPYLTTSDIVRAEARGTVADFEDWRRRTLLAIDQMKETVKVLPLSGLPVNPVWTPYFQDWLAHPTRDEFWRPCSVEDRHDRVTVPALNVGGWYDVFLDGTIRNFTGVRAKGATSEARDGSRLLLGPWTHSTPPSAQVGAIHYGMGQGQDLSPLSLDHDATQLRFFDYWLKGSDDGISGEPPVKIFVMGENRWRYETEWPLSRTEYTDFFLHSDGSANSAAGDGTLSIREPGNEQPDSFTYDPLDPVPTVGGQLCCYPPRNAPGAFDQRAVEARHDVLVFKSEPLEQDLEVTGPIILHLWAATTAPDTDYTAKLVDMAPDGYARNLTDGIIRACFRTGTDAPRPIVPNEPTNYTIDLWATSNLFRRGHRIVLEVSSSNFPRFDRNPNTGHSATERTELWPAVQTIYHDRERPSHLVLPIVRR